MKHSLPVSPQFYITGNQPCPYIPGFLEKKLFTTLNGKKAQRLNDSLSQQGFRRSQNIIYRPNCQNCNACRSVRIPVNHFVLSKSQKRILNKNDKLTRYECAPWATEDQFELFRKYINTRHQEGGMSEMDAFEFSSMIEETNVHTKLFEYYNIKNNLMAVSITDILSDGISMVYSFFDTNSPNNSLGKFMILDHIEITKRMGLKYLYLGYLIEASPKMNYKAKYKPLEYYNNGNWLSYDNKSNTSKGGSKQQPTYKNAIKLP